LRPVRAGAAVDQLDQPDCGSRACRLARIAQLDRCDLEATNPNPEITALAAVKMSSNSGLLLDLAVHKRNDGSRAGHYTSHKNQTQHNSGSRLNPHDLLRSPIASSVQRLNVQPQAAQVGSCKFGFTVLRRLPAATFCRAAAGRDPPIECRGLFAAPN